MATSASDVTIDNVDIGGFAVAIGTPNGDGNGDFIRIRDSLIVDGAYGIAITQTQSRNVEIRNVNYSSLHTFLTNMHFGIGNGMLSGPIDNVSGGAGYQILDLALGVSGPIKLTHLYTENQVRIGRLNANGAFPANVIFDSCNLGLEGKGGHNHAPPFMIEAAGNPEIVFRNAQMVASKRMFNMINATAATIVVDGGWFSSAYDITGPTRGANGYSRAINLTGGVLFGGGSARPDYPLNVPTVKIVSPFKASRADTSSPFTLGSQTIGEMMVFEDRQRRPANLYASGFYDTRDSQAM